MAEMQATVTYEPDEDVDVIQTEQAYYSMVDGDISFVISLDETEATVMSMTGTIRIVEREGTVFTDESVWVDLIPITYARLRVEHPE